MFCIRADILVLTTISNMKSPVVNFFRLLLIGRSGTICIQAILPTNEYDLL